MDSKTEVLPVTIFVDVILFILSLAALVVSVMVMYVGIFRQRIRGTDVLLLVLMSLVDSIIGIAWIIFSIGKWVSGYRILETDIWCQIQGSLSIGALEASSDCAAILAMLRYLVIVWRIPIHRFLWSSVSIGMVVLSLVFAVVSGANGMSVLMPVRSYCEPITLKGSSFSSSYGVWLLARIIIIPIVIVFCYSGIILHYHRLKLSLGFQLCDSDSPKLTRIIQKPHEINQTIYRLLAVCVAYTISFLPSFVANILLSTSSHTNDNVYFDAIIIISIMSIILINPLFAVLVHHETNQDLKSILFPNSLVESEASIS